MLNNIIKSDNHQIQMFCDFLKNYDKNLCRILNSYDIQNDNIFLREQESVICPNYSSSQELLSLLSILDCDNVNKTVVTFVHLSNESFDLLKNSKQYQVQFLYIDENIYNISLQCDILTDEILMMQMCNVIEFLCFIKIMLQRCVILANNMMHQSGAFLASATQNTLFKLFDFFDCFANILMQILIFDEMLPHSNISRLWIMYKAALEKISHSDTRKYFKISEIIGLENCVQELDLLLSGSLFQSFLDSTFGLKDKIGPDGISNLTTHFNEYVRYNIIKISKFDSPDLKNFYEPELIIRLNAMFVVMYDFCGKVDNKHVKSLLDINCKNHIPTLIGNVPWKPDVFLNKHAEKMMKSNVKEMLEVKRQRQIFICKKTFTLQQDCKIYCAQISLWSLHVENAINRSYSNLKLEQLNELSTLLLQGLRYTGKFVFLVNSIVNTHVFLQTSMSKSTLLGVCKLFTMMKSIQFVFKHNNESLSKITLCILQYLQYKIINIIAIAKKKKIYSAVSDRLFAAINILEKCMNGPITITRILIAKMAMNGINCLLESDQLTEHIEQIDLLENIHGHILQICNTPFIYFHQSILGSYLKQVMGNKIDFNTFQLIIESVNERGTYNIGTGITDLRSANVMNKSNFENMRKEIISNLCAQIETFLRLEVHSNLQIEKMYPFVKNFNDYRDLTNTIPIELYYKHIVLKGHVENYLSNMFYNLTTISLHDWKTYEEMRQLANYRFRLNPLKNYLPNQTLEQGIDILEIMRNIHIFVSQYVYNMHTQIFVEQHSTNKYLDTICIRHVANSLRTHGSGIINTTVNFTYQFLRQKFETFSQFLYDEQIKSRLMKELRAFNDRKNNNIHPLYPYERADAFNKDIRKLGLAADDQTYMDLFRRVITHIGNAIGYIRLVRSGSIHANYSASLYLPKFNENLQFARKSYEESLQVVTTTAAKNLEINLQKLPNSFSNGTDYFKILIETFQPFFQNVHLKFFYLIIPSLTLNYVEYILSEEGKINKKDKQGAIFFDDGFPVGLAYILKLLNQNGDFNSMQWFNTVRINFEAEYAKVKKVNEQMQRTSANNNGVFITSKEKNEYEKLQQTLALTERRVHAFQTNFNLLSYNLSSAKIFFL